VTGTPWPWSCLPAKGPQTKCKMGIASGQGHWLICTGSRTCKHEYDFFKNIFSSADGPAKGRQTDRPRGSSHSPSPSQWLRSQHAAWTCLDMHLDISASNVDISTCALTFSLHSPAEALSLSTTSIYVLYHTAHAINIVIPLGLGGGGGE